MAVTEKELSQITDLETALAVIKVLLAENRRLAERIAQLEKTSATSSKPPSSDIVKPKTEQKQRARGAAQRPTVTGHGQTAVSRVSPEPQQARGPVHRMS